MESPSLYSEKRSYLLQNMKENKFVRNSTKNPSGIVRRTKASNLPQLAETEKKKSLSLLSSIKIIDNINNFYENIDTKDNEKCNENQILNDEYNDDIILDSLDNSENDGSILDNELISSEKSQIFELQREIDRLKNKLNGVISSTELMLQDILESQQETELEFTNKEKKLQDENIKLNNEIINLKKIAVISKQECDIEKKKLSKSLRFIERFCSRNNKEKIPSFSSISPYIKTDMSSSKSTSK